MTTKHYTCFFVCDQVTRSVRWNAGHAMASSRNAELGLFLPSGSIMVAPLCIVAKLWLGFYADIMINPILTTDTALTLFLTTFLALQLPHS